MFKSSALSINVLLIFEMQLTNGALFLKANFLSYASLAAITHKIFEINSSFHVKWRSTGKISFLFFKSFLPVLTKL